MQMRLSTLFMFLLALVLSSGHAAHADADDFLIFKDARPTASITLPANATDDLRMVVEIFRQTIRAGYAVDIPLTQPGDGLNHLQLVLQKRTPLTEDRTTIDFPSENLMRIAGGESGLMRTLFVLLEDHAGVRFLYQGLPMYSADNLPDDLYKRMHFPSLTQLAIPRRPFTHDSAFPLKRSTIKTNRYFGVRGGGQEQRRYFWNWQMQLGAKDRVDTLHGLGAANNRHRAGRHNDGMIFPIDLYADGTMTPPPDEAFPILDGIRYLPYKQPPGRAWRAHWQPCFTSQAAEDEAVKNILATMEKYPETTSMTLSVNDNGNHCQCPTCMAMDGRSLNSLNMPNRSTSYYHWVNRVVTRVTKQHPDLMFGLIAYREVITPPAQKLHPNVTVEITMDYQSTIDPAVKASRQALIAQWNEKATNLSVYSYDVANWSWSLPRVYFQQMQEMLQYLHEHGGKGNFSEGAHYFTLSEGPRMYLYFKLLEDPYLDRQAVIQDWCEAAVGKQAATPLVAYFMFWENYWRTTAPSIDQFWDRSDATYLQRGHFATYIYGVKPGDFDHCRELMQQVVTLASEHGTPGQQHRAKLLMTCFEWYEAAANAASAQWVGVNGQVDSATHAVSLLNDIPRAVAGHARWREILETTDEWIASDAILRNERPGVVGFNMALVFPWTQDPQVQDALTRLADQPSLPAHLKRLAMLLRDQQASSAPAMHDDYENGAQGWDIAHPTYGSASSSKLHAASGDSSLQCNIEHANYAVEKKLPRLDKQSDYLITARIYLEPAGDHADGTVTFTGSPLPVGWSEPALKLQPGQWHRIHAYIPRSAEIDPDRMAAQMGGVSSNQDIRDMLTGRLRLRLRNFEKGSKAYLDDVRVYDLSQVK